MLQDARKQLFILLLAISCGMLLPFLGLTDFHTKGEPREAVVAYSMIETGNWILPTNAGGDVAYKPPFFHWCIAAVSIPFGEVNEYTSRLPSAIGLIWMTMALFLFFSKRTDPFRAFLAALINLVAFEVYRAGMNCRVDMVLTAAMVIALLELYKWWEKDLKGIPLGAILAMSCAVMTKGPVGFILPCASAGLFLLFNKTTIVKATGKMILAGTLSLLLPAAWYIAAYQQGGSGFIDLVLEENFGRFLGKMSYESHVRPISYNLVTGISGLLPWSLLGMVLFFLPYKRMNFSLSFIWQKVSGWFAKADRTDLYSILVIALFFLFYCIPKSKRSVYLLPIYPFIALFLADLFVWILRNRPVIWEIFGWVVASVMSLSMVLFGALRLRLISLEEYLSTQQIDKMGSLIDGLTTTPLSFIAVVSLIIAMAFIFAFFRDVFSKEVSAKLMLTTVGLVFGMQILLSGAILPSVLNSKSTKDFALEVGKLQPEGKIYGYIDDLYLRFYIINFYTGNRVFQFENELPTDGYLLIGKDSFVAFSEKYSDSYLFEFVQQTRHATTELGDFIQIYRFYERTEEALVEVELMDMEAE